MSVFKFKYHVGLGHTQVKVYAGPNWNNMANTGTLMMLKEEWDSLVYMMCDYTDRSIKFEEEP
jgi:hypothetical protein